MPDENYVDWVVEYVKTNPGATQPDLVKGLRIHVLDDLELPDIGIKNARSAVQSAIDQGEISHQDRRTGFERHYDMSRNQGYFVTERTD